MRRDARMHRPAVGISFVLLALALAGCAGKKPTGTPPTPPGPSPTPSPTARPAPGYEARIDSLDIVDSTAVRDRRIVIDPGHGGYFKGSLGVHGLTEAEVNLAVALELERLLVSRGAKVLM